jgi:diazepam-binding inhibitor (GABA receptor modulating acyl-CoA-binding protein)
MSAEFTAAADRVLKLATAPSQDEQLSLYSLFKQATVGDCTTEAPSRLKIKDHKKWAAWTGNKGMDKAAAEAAYIALVEKLEAKQ